MMTVWSRLHHTIFMSQVFFETLKEEQRIGTEKNASRWIGYSQLSLVLCNGHLSRVYSHLG